MALMNHGHYSPRSDAMRFSGASVSTAPAHGASLMERDGWFVNEIANIWDVDFILPTPPVSDKRPLGLPAGSTAEVGEKETGTLSSSDDRKMKVAPLIKLAGQEGPVRRFKVLQQFEGKVTELYEDSGTFRADLIDLTDSARERESAEFSLDDIHPADRSLVAPGSVFYWIMGFETTPSDYKRVSEIRLRRSPQWSEHEIEAITREGQEYFTKFTSRERNASKSK